MAHAILSPPTIPYLFNAGAAPVQKGFADCSGCSLCLPVCPVWRQTRDITLTPHGRAKALQNGAAPQEIAASLDTCTLCMACDPVCPENIDLSRMTIDLRRHGATGVALAERQTHTRAAVVSLHRQPSAVTRLLADPVLCAQPGLLARVGGLLHATDSDNDRDVDADFVSNAARIALALEAGVDIAPQRLRDFLAPLRKVRNLVVADALLAQYLHEHLPGLCVTGLGEALSNLVAVRQGLRPTDLYVIEPRAYHRDYRRLVLHYERLRAECGCAFNLDLQRIAIPATRRSLPQRLGLVATDDAAQTRWLLQGRDIRRIVIENAGDRTAFEHVTDMPVVHLAEVVDE